MMQTILNCSNTRLKNCWSNQLKQTTYRNNRKTHKLNPNFLFQRFFFHPKKRKKNRDLSKHPPFLHLFFSLKTCRKETLLPQI
ncbi:hypothetical protein L6452_33769 [Arctium lappa]|uniref:Uncharacterized protein n=1 Tax=Arctium lappa TaxID=4217 RepID=A0ACB8YGD4_ARCLA|nr:hypothetical protein L6452_33769 [Arctium lappa]